MPFSNIDDHKFNSLDNYKKEWLFVYEEKNYWKISPFSDGNCGLYAFACGLIDSIITGKLTIEDKKFDEFRDLAGTFFNSKSESISKFKHELALDLDKFTTLIYQPKLTFSQFKSFLKHQLLTPESLAAMNLILNQGLRYIGVTLYENFKQTSGAQGEYLEG